MKLQVIKSAVFGIVCAVTIFALLSFFPPTHFVEIRYPVKEFIRDTVYHNPPAKTVQIAAPAKTLNRHARRKATKKEQLYIDRFSGVARTEQAKFGIPASIAMAQGLLESNAGQSNLARKFGNHFGIKCFSRKCRKGHCGNFASDHHKDFFRKYESAWESWRAHSQFLQGERYKPLKKHGIDYKKWAHGLKKAGYAEDPKYAQKLIRLIEGLGLDRFDTME